MLSSQESSNLIDVKRDRPQVIFLDAVGTLFGVQGSVGEQYAKLANRFGVVVPAETLNRAFFESFKASSAPAFPGCDPKDLQAQEYAWWRAIAVQTFKQANAIDHFSDFDQFFAEVYDYFATAEPWIVYADVSLVLKRWHQQGIPLGIISNFDSRIYAVLRALGLLDYFSSITISTEVGTAKPSPQIFAAALHKHHCSANSAWHIGDSLKEDYHAAQSAGLHGIWLKRNE